MAGNYDEFVQAVMADVLADGGERARCDVARYYDPVEPYTGSKFETLTDRDHPDRISATDIVAVSTLSVNIPPNVAIWLLSDEGRLRVSSLLANVPANVDLWERPDLLAPDGDLWRVWYVLTEGCWPASTKANGMGTTKTSKLLAAKRPRLVPVFDRVVREALPSLDSHWAAFAAVVAGADRRAKILEVSAAAPPHVSLLRRLDVILWMAHKAADSHGS